MSKPTTPSLVPPTEVPAKKPRRRFTAEFKRRVLAELDGCKKPGEVGALLRREGLYSSHVVEWRRARDRGDLAGETKKRGPKPKLNDERDARIAQLERENARLEKRAKRAEALVDLQKKVAELLGNSLPDPEDPS
jgi:transposase-like protein